jgi:hypothetical protein
VLTGRRLLAGSLVEASVDHRHTAAALAGLALSAAVTVTGCATERPGPLVNMRSSAPTPSQGWPEPSPTTALDTSAAPLPLPPSPEPSATPAASDSAGPSDATAPEGPDQAPDQAPDAGMSSSALRPHAHLPGAGRPAPAPRPQAQPGPRPAPTATGTGMCALAEQYGQLAPGSEQAKLCKGIYGG